MDIPNHSIYMKNDFNLLRAPYEAPEVLPLPISADGAVCQTSLGAGEIQPGTGENWGTF